MYRLSGFQDWFDKTKFDGKFQKVVVGSFLMKYPFSESVYGFERITWYQIQKEFWKYTLYTAQVTRIVDETTNDSILRGAVTPKKLRNILDGNLLR